jgi:hypothetical protein
VGISINGTFLNLKGFVAKSSIVASLLAYLTSEDADHFITEEGDPFISEE